MAGKGGDGRASFSKTFQNEFGGANGGDGGNGAHIIFQGKTYQTVELSLESQVMRKVVQ